MASGRCSRRYSLGRHGGDATPPQKGRPNARPSVLRLFRKVERFKLDFLLSLGRHGPDDPRWQATPPGWVARGTHPPSAALRPSSCNCPDPPPYPEGCGLQQPVPKNRALVRHSVAPSSSRETPPWPTAATNPRSQPRSDGQPAHISRALCVAAARQLPR